MPGRLKVVNLEKDCPLYIYILPAPDVWVIKFLLKYLKLCSARHIAAPHMNMSWLNGKEVIDSRELHKIVFTFANVIQWKWILKEENEPKFDLEV